MKIKAERNKKGVKITPIFAGIDMGKSLEQISKEVQQIIAELADEILKEGETPLTPEEKTLFKDAIFNGMMQHYKAHNSSYQSLKMMQSLHGLANNKRIEIIT